MITFFKNSTKSQFLKIATRRLCSNYTTPLTHSHIAQFEIEIYSQTAEFSSPPSKKAAKYLSLVNIFKSVNHTGKLSFVIILIPSSVRKGDTGYIKITHAIVVHTNIRQMYFISVVGLCSRPHPKISFPFLISRKDLGCELGIRLSCTWKGQKNFLLRVLLLVINIYD